MPLRSLFHDVSRFSLVPPQLRWLYFSVVMQRISEALLLVISPLFLFQLAPQIPYLNQIFSSDIKTGLFFITIYYMAERLMVILLAPLLARISITKDIRLSMVLGRSAFLLSIIIFTFLEKQIELVLFLPILGALTMMWYWSNYYLLLAAEIDLSKVGKEMGGLEIVSKLSTVIGPLLGVVLALNISFQGAFWLAILFQFLAILGLIKLPSLRVKTVWHWSDFLSAIKLSIARRQLIGMSGEFWERRGLSVYWPIILFIMFGGLMAVGYVFTGATLISLIFIYLSGWIFDKHRRKTSLGVKSGTALALIWLVRAFSWQLPILSVLAEVADRFASGVFQTFYSSLLLLRIRANNSIIYAYNRQIAMALANLVGGTFVLLVLWLDLGLSWIIGSFFFAGLAALIFVKDRRLRYRLDK